MSDGVRDCKVARDGRTEGNCRAGFRGNFETEAEIDGLAISSDVDDL